MLETIPPHEVGLDGKALTVRYRQDPEQPDLLLVTITAHITHGEPDDIQMGELGLVTVEERMSREAMQARVEAEAERRAIVRVAWIEEVEPGFAHPGPALFGQESDHSRHP